MCLRNSNKKKSLNKPVISVLTKLRSQYDVSRTFLKVASDSILVGGQLFRYFNNNFVYCTKKRSTLIYIGIYVRERV